MRSLCARNSSFLIAGRLLKPSQIRRDRHGNVRLFEEVRARARDLSSRCSSKLRPLGVLGYRASTGELEPVFQKMLENATRVCGANFSNEPLRNDSFRNAAFHNAPPAF